MELKDIFLIKYSNDSLFEVISEHVNKLDTFYSKERNGFKIKLEAILNKYKFSNRQDILKDGIIPHIMLSKEPGSFEIKLFFDWDGGIGTIDSESVVLIKDPEIYSKELSEVDEFYEDIHLNYFVTWMAIIWQEVKVDNDSLIVVLSENSTTYTFVFNDMAWDKFSSYSLEYEIDKPVIPIPSLDMVTIYRRVRRTYPYNKYKYREYYFANEDKIKGIVFYRNILGTIETKNKSAELKIVNFDRALDLIEHVNKLELNYSLEGYQGKIVNHINQKPYLDDAYSFNIQCINPDIYEIEKYSYHSDEMNHLENEIRKELPKEYKAFLRIISSYPNKKYTVRLNEKINGKEEAFKFYNLKELNSLSSNIQSKDWMIIGTLYSGGNICLSLLDSKSLKVFTEPNSKPINITTQLEDIWKTHLIF